MSKRTFRNSAFYKPNVVQIEFVQGCNRRCHFCGTRGISEKLRYITEPILEKQCRLIEASGYNPRILLSGHGENTLHPNFYEFVALMRKLMPNAWIQIMTNGQSFRRNMRNLGRMYIEGINDVTLDEYSDSRFNMEDFLPELAELHKKRGIRVETAIMAPGVPLYLPKNTKHRRFMIVPPIDNDEITMSRVLTNHCGAGMRPTEYRKNITCTKIFRELSFRWDGSVAICCQDFRGQYRVANVMDKGIDTFDDLWRHDRLESARRILYHDKRTFFPCNICDTPALRPGLLPDARGKESMERPEQYDYELVNKRWRPMSEMVPRSWEKNGITDAKNLNLER
jgi:uncharacterized radical SAM superfamily protein